MSNLGLTIRLKQARKLGQCLRRRPFRRGLRYGVAAGVEHLALLRPLELASVVDIGANVGQFSLAVLALHPRARIHAFEPLSAPAATFEQLFAREAQVTLRRSAIGPTEDTATMHVSRRNDSSSLLPITALQTATFPGTDETRTESVQVAPLDSFIAPEEIERPALLKLDVQGFELEALRGCASLLPRFAYVYVEASFIQLYAGQALAHEVIAFLAEFGFTITGVYNSTYDLQGRSIQADFLFRPAVTR